MKNIAIAFVAMFLIFSCTPRTKADITYNAQPSLIRTSWELADKVSGKVPTLILEEGKVSGNSGCNSFFAEVKEMSSNGSLSFDKMGSTRMMCAAKEMETESYFLSMLSKVNKYSVSGETLELYQDKLLLLKFNKIK
jgi:heat shock protein HslJ